MAGTCDNFLLDFIIIFKLDVFYYLGVIFFNIIGNPVEIRGGPTAVIGDKSRILPLSVYKLTGRLGY